MIRIIFQNMKENAQKDINHIKLSPPNQVTHEHQALQFNLTTYKLTDKLCHNIPHPIQFPDRSLVFDCSPQVVPIHTIIESRHSIFGTEMQEDILQQFGGLHIFKSKKKEKVRSRCDYDKNICGYITKKIIREFASENYEKQVLQLVRKYRSSYNECICYYIKKVQLVTGPSHLPELLHPSPNEPEAVSAFKKVFKQFYRWFLKERYLRYLLVQGKMSNKRAYIQYKNTHLINFVQGEYSQPPKEEQQHKLSQSPNESDQ